MNDARKRATRRSERRARTNGVREQAMCESAKLSEVRERTMRDNEARARANDARERAMHQNEKTREGEQGAGNAWMNAVRKKLGKPCGNTASVTLNMFGGHRQKRTPDPIANSHEKTKTICSEPEKSETWKPELDDRD